MQAARRRRSYRKDAFLFELVARYRKDNRHRDIAPLFIVHAGTWGSGNGRQRPCLSAVIDKCRNRDRAGAEVCHGAIPAHLMMKGG